MFGLQIIFIQVFFQRSRSCSSPPKYCGLCGHAWCLWRVLGLLVERTDVGDWVHGVFTSFFLQFKLYWTVDILYSTMQCYTILYNTIHNYIYNRQSTFDILKAIPNHCKIRWTINNKNTTRNIKFIDWVYKEHYYSLLMLQGAGMLI